MSEQTLLEGTKTQAELLTERFYEWERLGRGWPVWDFPVGLEPPFTPFRFHWIPPEPTADDGRRPTLLSTATDWLIARLSPSISDPELPLVESEQSEPEIVPSTIEWTELCVSMPPDADIAPEEVEHFLLAVPRSIHPLAFEIVGTAESISVQLAVPEGSTQSVRSQLQAYIPRASVTEAPVLEAAFGDATGNLVVVDFGLRDEFMLPLRTFKRFSVDPFSGICAALSDLDPGECGAIQVLLEPVRHPWARSILKAVLDDSGSPFFLDAPEIVPLAKEKVSRPLYACVIRVAGQGATVERSLEIAQNLGWTLNALANPPSNRLIPLSGEGYPEDAHAEDFLLRRTRRSGMIVSLPELVGLVHPPTSAVRAAKLLRDARSTNRVPEIATGHTYRLGTNEHAGKSLDVSLSSEHRSRHVYVVGASGVGKSTLLMNLILQDLEAGEGLAVFDPHGELVDEVLRRCPQKRIDDVVLLDPADGEYPIGFNILSAHSELERTLLSSDLVSVFRRLSTSWGDQMTSVLGNGILAFLESERGGTLVDLRRFLVEGEFRREYLKTVRDPEVVYYWQKEFPLLSGKPQAPLLTRLDTFLRPKTIRYMVAQKESRLDLRKLMDSGGVLLCRLSQGAIGEENSYLLGTLLTAKLNQIATSRQDVAAAERRPFYLYIDEFHNFVTPSMEQILSGARKYKLGLILAHHELQQIRARSPEVLSSVLTNPYTRICFRVGEQDARSLSEGFGHFNARDLQSLGIGEAIARVERSEFDFNLRTACIEPLGEDAGEDVRRHIIDRSRAHYGRARAEIEAALEGYGTRDDGSPTSSEHRRRPEAVPSPSVEAPTASKQRQVPFETSTVHSQVPTEPSPGRGGPQHKYLQEIVRQWADANGWRSGIEEAVPGGRVDIALYNAQRSIACEIGVSTSAEHEFKNAGKCLDAGFERVILVTQDRKVRERLKGLTAGLPKEQSDRIGICEPRSVLGVLQQLHDELAPAAKTISGYRVKLRHQSIRPEEAKKRRGMVSAIIAKALRRGHGRK